MAHAEPDAQQVHVDNIRRLSDELGEPIAILVDLAGPKIRLGELPDDRIFCEVGRGVCVRRRQRRNAPQRADVDLRAAGEGTVGRRSRDAGRRHGEHGRGRGRSRAGRSCKVVQRGTIRSRQGINLPGAKLSAPAISVARSSARDLGRAGGRRLRQPELRARAGRSAGAEGHRAVGRLECPRRRQDREARSAGAAGRNRAGGRRA